ncbi:hypothetical protein V2S84_01145, partial [Azotobacter chroococcum]|nr:hypothetical protein [Azotobacter chroococcum]
VDIAVPRDIEPEVGELDDIYLYSVDDLHEVIEENLRSRQGAAQAAEELVAAGADDFMLRLRELAAVDVLKAYRQQAERLRDEELAKAQRLLADINQEYPANPQVAPSAEVAAWGSFKADSVPVEVAGKRQAEAIRLMDRAGWN